MREIQILRDPVAEKLDEMADLAALWKRHREAGRHPRATRAAMLMLSREMVAMVDFYEAEQQRTMDELCGPSAYQRNNGEEKGS